MPKGFPKNGINNGWIKKGEHRGTKTEFKKGMVISLKKRQMISERTKGEKNPFYGKKHTDETKNKIREASNLTSVISGNVSVDDEDEEAALLNEDTE